MRLRSPARYGERIDAKRILRIATHFMIELPTMKRRTSKRSSLSSEWRRISGDEA
jgi:hypothetical protein